MRARKRFGQHFLEPAWVVRLVDAIGLAPGDTVLEIGPGRGALTTVIAPRVKTLIAVEIDRDLAAALQSTIPSHVRIVTGDFLDVDLDEMLAGEATPIRVVGNLPYNVASPILFKLLASHRAGGRFSDATLMLQREVADRLAAVPGTGEYGVLGIQAAVHADVERLMTLPPGAFRPPPQVTSAVVRLRFHQPSVEEAHLPGFEHLVRGIFTQRRKTLLNALKPVVGRETAEIRQLLEREGIDPARRPETLSLADLTRLCYIFPGSY